SETRIRFGLAGIKGVGEAAAQKIIEERRANGPFKDFRDFVHRVDSRAINRRVLECLVKAGAFDFTEEPRGSIFHRLDELISDAAARQRDLSLGQESFFDMLQAATPPAPPRKENVDTAKAFTQAEMLQFEKELLGFYISGHPLDAFAGLAEAISTSTAEELPALPDRTEFRICGVASGITKRLSKRDNQPWAFFNLATRTGTIQVQCYSDAYAEYGTALENERVVMLIGTVLARDGDVRYSVREIHGLDRALPALIKKLTWILRPGAEADDFMAALREAIDTRSGATTVEIGFLGDDDFVAIAELSGALRWQIDPPEFKKLRRHRAVAGCMVEAKSVQAAEPKRRWGKRATG
ncbi:MAG: OB-fold nucleic acid binding domain-containing protein, partial [Opitutaceae bacterium]